MNDCPLEKLPKFGMKFDMEKLKHLKKVSDLKTYSKNDLKTLFGDDAGEWLYNACRGIHKGVVKPKGN